jgi:hypothetical protein
MATDCALAAPGQEYGTASCRRPAQDEENRIQGAHRLPLMRPARRTWLTFDRVAATQSMGRRRHLGAHLANDVGQLRSPRQVGVGTSVSGRLLCARQKGGCAVGKTKKGKGTKWMLVCDGNGIPIGFHLDSASSAEVKLAPATLQTVRVRSRSGPDRTRPHQLVAPTGC